MLLYMLGREEEENKQSGKRATTNYLHPSGIVNMCADADSTTYMAILRAAL